MRHIDHNTFIASSVSDIQKAKNRANCLISNLNLAIERNYRNCDSVFEYPNGNEAYERYLQLIDKQEANVAILEQISNELSDIITKYENLKL